MDRTIAKAISSVFHPLWMPLLTLVIAFFVDPFLGLHPAAFIFLLAMLFMNAALPGLTILYMARKNMISNLEISNRTERWVPFFLVFGYYIISYVLLRTKVDFVPPVVYSIFFALLTSLLTALVVNNFTKISVHLMAFGGFLGTLAALNVMHYLGQGLFIGLLLLVGSFVAWSRLVLNVHTHKQLYLGFSVGFCIHFFMITYGIFF
ncbi:MAG: hypothetical protein RL226_2152 [Bacteroidota bacterium]|jgi:membrane-associated phospholipid phosphatase